MKFNLSLLFTAALTTFISCNNPNGDLENGLYAKMTTSKGELLLKLHSEETPITVASFVSLAEGNSKRVSDNYANQPYYNGTQFHRVINDFMIQGGDPTATGQGGPGYRFKDEFVDTLRHDSKGVLSMANSGPFTNGSQFFITHKETPWLDGKHTVFGRLVSGEATLDSIATTPTDPTDRPLEPVTLETVEIIRVGSQAKKFNAVETLEDYFNAIEEEVKRNAEAKKERQNEFEKRFENAELSKQGVEYVIERQGTGETLAIGTEISVNYAGWLVDGTLFDTNIQSIAERDENFDQINAMHRGQFIPMKTSVDPDAAMIAGFKEALMTMKVGELRWVRIPSVLGFGSNGAGNVIPPGADLVFSIELLAELPKR